MSKSFRTYLQQTVPHAFFIGLMSVSAPTFAAIAEQLASADGPIISAPEEESESAGNGGVAQVEADNMAYDEKNSVVTASGNVNVWYSKQSLKAEKVSYNQNQNVMSAEGNVQFEDGQGNTFYANKAELNDTLTDGTIEELNGTLSDNSRFAADEASRQDGNVMTLKNAVYSPCKICEDGEKHDPLWRVTAEEVTLNEDEERMYYKNATFDVFGMPILYTPYFSHPTPNASRKTGFLVPTYSNISTLGFTVKAPYYVNIAPNMDATITPFITTEEGNVLMGDFRHLTSNGRYELSGSITNPTERDSFGNRVDGHKLRGHIEGKGQFDLGDSWTAGFDGKRSTDDTYLQRYRFGDEDLLTSTGYVERLDGFNYVGARAISFQGLNVEDDPDTTPLVLPLVKAHYEGRTGFMSSRWTVDGDALALTRDTGVDSRRVSLTGGWEVPFMTQGGHVFSMRNSVRGDIYNVEDVAINGITKDGYIGRAIPEMQLGWRYPLLRADEDMRVFVEPVVDLILSPHGGNPDKIPNEDSQEVELSDVNIFSNNHFTGLDRVEGGPRSNYGVRGGVTHTLGNLDFLLGQSYRTKTLDSFTPQSGLDDNFSDYVGRLTVSDVDRITEFSYRFRSDKDDFMMRRNEFGTRLNLDRMSLEVGYVLLDEDNEAFDRQEVYGATSIRLSDSWSIQGGGRRDLRDEGGWVSANAGLVYEDECIRLMTQWNREFTRDRDIEPSTSYTFRVAFKNFGNI